MLSGHFSQFFEVSFAGGKSRGGRQACYIQDITPPVSPVMAKQGICDIAGSYFAETLRLGIEVGEYFRHIWRVKWNRYNGIGPIEVLSESLIVGGDADHYCSGSGAFEETKTDLILAMRFKLPVALGGVCYEVAASFGDIGDQVAVLGWVEGMQSLDRVVDIKYLSIGSHVQ